MMILLASCIILPFVSIYATLAGENVTTAAGVAHWEELAAPMDAVVTQVNSVQDLDIVASPPNTYAKVQAAAIPGRLAAEPVFAVVLDGETGCCPIGESCTGNPPPPTTRTTYAPPPPTSKTTALTTTKQSTSPTPTSTFSPPQSPKTTPSHRRVCPLQPAGFIYCLYDKESTSTASSSALAVTFVPTPPAGSRSVIITADDVSITWQGTFLHHLNFRYASIVYLNLATRNTYFDVYVNGIATTYSPNDSRITNCEYGWSISSSVGVTYNITVLVYGQTSLPPIRWKCRLVL
ncbi:hypothetical protein BDQ17DRAFT_1324705 [Cyathus striatus]|nr:hypothetical protein BDQ17DRAFT_1324705 [Cyathus striatus]